MTPWTRKYKLSYPEVAQVLENFLEGDGNPLAWDGFTLGMSFDDEYLEEIRIRCASLNREFPPDNPNEFCNDEGRNVIRAYVKKLRALDRRAD